MDARNFAKTRNYINEVKYETQIYWFVLISLLLALMVGASAIRDANSAAGKNIQLPASIFSDSPIAGAKASSVQRAQFTDLSGNGQNSIFYQGGT